MIPVLLALALQAAPVPTPAGERPVEPYVQADANAGATPIRGAAVFAAFHGEPGVRRITSRLVDLNLVDPRIKEIFVTTDVARVKRTLYEQFCYLLGGPCTYTGRDMTASHKGQGLQASDFNALVENLQKAMDEERVPFSAQNKLLAKLAPMERVVVERKSPAALAKWRKRLNAALHPEG